MTSELRSLHEAEIVSGHSHYNCALERGRWEKVHPLDHRVLWKHPPPRPSPQRAGEGVHFRRRHTLDLISQRPTLHPVVQDGFVAGLEVRRSAPVDPAISLGLR